VGNQARKAEERRKRQRTQLIASAILVLLAIGGTAVFLAMSRDDTAKSPNEANAFAGGAVTLIYADFADKRDLHRLDLETKEDSVSGDLPIVGQTEAALGSELFTIGVVEEGDNGDLKPHLYIYDPADESVQPLGIGVEPTWSPDGSRLAWATPEDPDECGEERCRGDMSVMVRDVETGDTEELVESGVYTVVDWAGDYLLIQNEAIPDQPVLHSVSPDGDISDLPFRPIEYWGASPDGRYIVQSGEAGVSRFLELEDGRVSGEGADIGIPEGTKLGAGAWAHDSSGVAAFALGDDGLEFVYFSPSSPDPQTLAEGGESSVGVTLWSPDNDRVVFQRFTGAELEAVSCPIVDPDACEVVLTWTRGLALLRVE
jgi:hypothetical protein